jgi:drug/metabolite transporter (DMT)-like permease
MGLLNNVLPFSLIFWGQTQIASGLASILNATTPLFTLLFAGVALLIGPELLVGGASVWGELACQGAAISYAFAGVYGRRFKTMKIAPIEAAAGQVTASTVLILPIMLAVEQPWTLQALPSPTVWAALGGLAMLSTALAYVLYFRILAAAGATNLLLVTFLIPVTAILLGAAGLGERLAPRHFAGMALIGLGLAVTDGRIARLLRPAK